MVLEHVRKQRSVLLMILSVLSFNLIAFESAHAQSGLASCLNRTWMRALSEQRNGGIRTIGALVSDASGNIYITGAIDGNELNQFDWVTLRLNADGVLEWRHIYDNSGQIPNEPSRDQGLAMALDTLGNLYVTGVSTSNTAADFLTIKYSPTGEVIWEQRYDGSSVRVGGRYDDAPVSIHVTDTRVIVAGISTNESWEWKPTILFYDLDGHLLRKVLRNESEVGKLAIATDNSVYLLTESLDAQNRLEPLLVKYSPDGDLIWQQGHRTSFPNLIADHPVDFTIDSQGNIYVLVKADLIDQYSYTDFAILKYSPDGDLRWEKSFGASQSAQAYPAAIAVTSDNFLVIAGKHISNSSNSPFVTRYSPDGVRQWWHVYSTDGYYEVKHLNVDHLGQVYLTGSRNGSLIVLRYAPNGYLRSVERDDGANLLALHVTIDPYGNLLLSESQDDAVYLRKFTPDKPTRETMFAYIDGLFTPEGDDYNSIDTYGVVRANLSKPAQDELTLQFFVLRQDSQTGRLDFEPHTVTIFKGRQYGEVSVPLTRANREIDPPRQVQLSFLCHPDVTITNPKVRVAIWDDDFEADASPALLANAPLGGAVTGVHVDQAGNIYFGTSSNMNLQKLTRSGQLLWQTSQTGAMFAMPVSPNGDIAVAGRHTLDATERHAVFVYNADGNLRWSHFAQGTSNEGNVANFAVFDQSGNLYVAGTLYNVYWLSNGEQLFQSDMLLTKYTALGQIVWQERMSDGRHGSFAPTAIHVDASGNTLVAASYVNTQTDRALLLKYDANGTLLWRRDLSKPESNGFIDKILLRNDGAIAIQLLTWKNGYRQKDVISVLDTNGFVLWESSCWLEVCEFKGVQFDSSGKLYFASRSEIFIYSPQGILERQLAAEGIFIANFVIQPNDVVYVTGSSSGRFALGAYHLRGYRLWRQTLEAGRGITILTEPDGNLLVTGEYFSLNTSTLVLSRHIPPFNSPEARIESAVVVEGRDEIAQADITVRLSAPLTAPITLTYSTVAGSALPAEDYIDAAGAITLPAGAQTATIRVPILNDDLQEASEMFFINIDEYQGLYLDRPQATVWILDRDTLFAFLPIVGR